MRAVPRAGVQEFLPAGAEGEERVGAPISGNDTHIGVTIGPLQSCFAGNRQDYIVKLIEDAEAAQLRQQSPEQIRPDRNEQRYHKPDCQSHECAGSQSARKHLLFAGGHFNLLKGWYTLPHPRATVTVQTIISPVSYQAALLKSNGRKIKLRHYPALA